MASPLLTGRDVVSNALKLLGVIAQGETPTATELADGLLRLNELIDNWSLQSLTALVNERRVFTLTANQQDYTLGPTGDFVVANRPARLTNASLLLNTSSPSIEMSVAIMTDDQYAGLSMKTLGNQLFTRVGYTPTSPNGSIFLWPNPTTAVNDLVLYFDSILVQFATLTQSYQLPAGYAKALRYNLAVELAPEFGRQVDQVIERIAATSLRQLKAANVKPTELSMPAGLGSMNAGSYNIYTDGR